MKQAVVRKGMYDSLYRSYRVTNLRQLSNHPWLRSTLIHFHPFNPEASEARTTLAVNIKLWARCPSKLFFPLCLRGFQYESSRPYGLRRKGTKECQAILEDPASP